MFTPIAMVFKMSEIAIFVFCADSKKFVTVWAIYLNSHGRYYQFLSENDMVNILWTYLFVRYCG